MKKKKLTYQVSMGVEPVQFDIPHPFTWSMDQTFAIFIRDGLRRFAAEADGTYPEDLTSSFEEWVKMLQDLSDEFDWYAQRNFSSLDTDRLRSMYTTLADYMPHLWWQPRTIYSGRSPKYTQYIVYKTK